MPEIHLDIGSTQISQRWMKKNEVEEVSEEAKEELEKKKAAHEKSLAALQEIEGAAQIEKITLHTDITEETLVKELKNIFALKVILVNHEKRLTVDTTCANLAIKYNLIYISVYQLIK